MHINLIIAIEINRKKSIKKMKYLHSFRMLFNAWCKKLSTQIKLKHLHQENLNRRDFNLFATNLSR